MQDVRNRLVVISIRWKIEKRVKERMCHEMRMEYGKITKAAVLGWLGELKEWKKAPGKKRKTDLNWKKLVKEVGWNEMDIDRVVSDRKTVEINS